MKKVSIIVFTLILLSCINSNKIIKNIDRSFGTELSQKIPDNKSNELDDFLKFKIGKTTINDIPGILNVNAQVVKIYNSINKGAYTYSFDNQGNVIGTRKKFLNGYICELSKGIKELSIPDSIFPEMKLMFYENKLISISSGYPIELKNDFVKKFGEGRGYEKCFSELKDNIVYKDIREQRTWINKNIIIEYKYDVVNNYHDNKNEPIEHSYITIHDNTSLYDKYLKELEFRDENYTKTKDKKGMEWLMKAQMSYESKQKDYKEKIESKYGRENALLIEKGDLKLGMTKEMCVEILGRSINKTQITDANGEREIINFFNKGINYSLEFNEDDKLIKINKTE